MPTDAFYWVRFPNMLNFQALKFLKKLSIVAGIDKEESRTFECAVPTPWDRWESIQILSGRVTRVGTRLTVHCSQYIRMLSQLVADFPGERLSIYISVQIF